MSPRSALVPLLPLLALCMGQGTPAAPQPTSKTPATRAEIVAVMEKMADAQLAQPGYRDSTPNDWVAGAFYVGLSRLSHTSANPKYLAAEKAIAENNAWEFKTNGSARNIAMADNETIGQMYIDIAVAEKDLAKLDKIKKQWDGILAGFENPTPEIIRSWNGDVARDGKPMPWWWCDAFFMAPPGLARLSEITWDRKYIDAMDKQWWVTYDKLYDKEEHLFYRDSKYLTQKTANGKKTFWSRGNGWVVAGTCNMLPYMPKDYPTRPKYEQMLVDMCTKLASIQQDTGLWTMSLADAAANPNAETSGTAFFAYAMAWGVNNHLLEREKFEPVIDKAWAALNRHVMDNGLIGAVQPVGEAPVSTSYEKTSQPYAVGGFLLSGCEIIKMHGNK